MALKQNTAEGYTNGATVAAGTSGSGSGDAFNTVFITTGTPVTASTAQHAHGLVAYKFNEATAANVAHVDWTGYSAASMAGRFYIYINTMPSAQTRVAAFRTSTGNACSVVLAGPNGSGATKFNVTNAAGTYLGVTTSANPVLSTATWYRVEWECNTGADTSSGTINFRFYSLDSTTALYSFSTSTTNASALNVTEARFGKLDGTGSADFYLDDIAVNDGSIAPLGPSGGSTNGLVQAVVATASESDPIPSVDAQTVVSGGGVATATGLAYAPNVGNAGPSGSGVTAKVATATGKAIPTLPRITSSLTATADPTNSPPRVVLDLGALATGTIVTITRFDNNGTSTTVRGADNAVISGSSGLFFDYQAPYNQGVTYFATINGAAQTLSASVLLSVDQPWLVHPNIPSLSVPLTVVAPPTRTRVSNRGLFHPLGRSDAVAISDGRRKDASFELHVRTDTLDEENALDALLDDDSVLLLQITYSNMTRAQYSWVSIGDAVAAPMIDTWDNDYYDWALPCDIAAPPVGLVEAQRTLADIAAEWNTLGDIDNAYVSLRNIVTDSIAS